MKTILWATLTANGNYARAEPGRPPKPETLADFAEQVREHRNFVVGRRTFEEFRAQPQRSASDAGSVFASSTIVVVSSIALPGVVTAATPRAALELLAERGHSTALVAGGAQLHNAFLAEELVHELILNVVPTFEDDGLRLVLPAGRYRELSPLGSRALGAGVLQQRYAL